jgi:hypothetical protein
VNDTLTFVTHPLNPIPDGAETRRYIETHDGRVRDPALLEQAGSRVQPEGCLRADPGGAHHRHNRRHQQTPGAEDDLGFPS